MTDQVSPSLRQAVAVFALVAAACAPAVPDIHAASGDAAAAGALSSTTTTVSEDAGETTTTVGATSTTSSSTTSTSTSSTTTTSTTAAPPEGVTVGGWTVTPDTRDESGRQFAATVVAPRLIADVDPTLLGRTSTLVEGRVTSQVGATLALWRSIEEQEARDLTGSTLEFDYEIAAFEEGFLALRLFSEEQVAGAGSAKRQVTTLMVDLVNGVGLALDDIVFDGDSRVALLELVRAGLLAEYFEGDEDAFNLWASNVGPDDLDSTVLTPEGLEVWFDELEVGPPTIGMPVILVPYSALDGILDPAGAAGLFL